MFFSTRKGVSRGASAVLATQKVLSSFFVLFLVMGMLSFIGCKTDDDDFVDDHKLNTGLIGTWKGDFGDGDYDQYIISETTLKQEDTFGTNTSGTIAYIYNFSETAGVLIIKYAPGSTFYAYLDVGNKYGAIYFNGIKAQSVKLGGATNFKLSDEEKVDWPDYFTDLDEAKQKFAPGNIDKYSGDLSDASTLAKQP
jgi:hypothetical protein